MAELSRGQEGSDSGGIVPELPAVNGPCWATDRLAISLEWVAFKDRRRAPWNVIHYAADSSVRRGDYGRIVLSGPDAPTVVIGEQALRSLEACELLADGLSTTPAASAAGQLLEPWLAPARSRRDASLVRVHRVNRSGTTHTFHSMRGFHLVTGIFLAVGGVGLLVGEAFAIAYPFSKWAQDSSTSDYIWGAVTGLLLAWVGLRMARVGVHISREKMTMRGYFVTRKVSASHMRAITFQQRDNGAGQLRWIPQVELTSGKTFWIQSFDCGPARYPPKPAMAAIIEEVRTLLGVGIPDPGDQPILGYVDGGEAPRLQAEPADRSGF